MLYIVTHLDVRPGVLPDLLDLAALLPDDAGHDGLVDQQPDLPRPAILLINAETHDDDNYNIDTSIDMESFLVSCCFFYATVSSPSLLVHEGDGHLQHRRHRLAAPAAQAHDELGPGAGGDTNLEQTESNHHHLHINVIY